MQTGKNKIKKGKKREKRKENRSPDNKASQAGSAKQHDGIKYHTPTCSPHSDSHEKTSKVSTSCGKAAAHTISH